MPDKRLLMRATAVLVLGGTLLAGCGRGSQPRTAPPAGASTSAPATPSAKPSTQPASSAKAGADADLDNADNLLQQVDGQVSAADKTPADAD